MKFSNPYLANEPAESHALNTPTAYTENSQLIVIRKLTDWLLHEYINFEIQWIGYKTVKKVKKACTYW